MAKNFLDVFPDLHMASEMEELFKLVEVERISAPRNRSSLRIYIVSPRLIHRKNLYDLDENASLRFSHENPDVRTMYESYFGNPNSHKAHMLLHTEHERPAE